MHLTAASYLPFYSLPDGDIRAKRNDSKILAKGNAYLSRWFEVGFNFDYKRITVSPNFLNNAVGCELSVKIGDEWRWVLRGGAPIIGDFTFGEDFKTGNLILSEARADWSDKEDGFVLEFSLRTYKSVDDPSIGFGGSCTYRCWSTHAPQRVFEVETELGATQVYKWIFNPGKPVEDGMFAIKAFKGGINQWQ